MVTTELNSPRPLANVGACAGLLCAITGAGVVAGVIDPGLALARAPHPALEPTLGAWASIVANNARTLAAPLLLAGLGLHRRPSTRRLADLAVLSILLINGGLVGVELGRWQTHLLAYLPQLPLEWLAAATAASGWASSRQHTQQPADRRALALTALMTAALLCAAAAVEVLLTPHATRPR